VVAALEKFAPRRHGDEEVERSADPDQRPVSVIAAAKLDDSVCRQGVDLIVTSPRGDAEVIASNFEPTFAAAASL